MKKLKQLLTILLALTMLLSVVSLSSCRKDPPEDEEDPSKEGNSGELNKPVDYLEFLPNADFDQADVNIIIMENRKQWFGVDANDTDLCDVKIVARNDFVEKNYNVYLNYTPTTEGYAGFHEICRKDLWSGTAEYDITSPDYYYGTDIGGYFLNLADFDEIVLGNPYWLSGWNDCCTINGKIFTAASYAVMDPISQAMALFMNNYYALDTGIDVDKLKNQIMNGNWYLEDMLGYMELATFENGDGVYDFNDRYGLAYNLWGGRAMLWSCGLSLIEITEDGNLNQTYTKDRNITVFQAVYDLFNTKKDFSYYGGGAGSLESSVGDVALFNANRALFAADPLSRASIFSANLDSFSILPMPKLDSDQKNYITSLGGTCVFAIMKTAKDPKMSATILEALSILGYMNVRPVYYEKSLKLKYSTDPETGEMLDLIMSNVSIDYSFVSSALGNAATTPFDTLILGKNRNYVSGMKKLINEFEESMKNLSDVYSDKTNDIGPSESGD